MNECVDALGGGHEILACCQDLKISKIFECCFECIGRCLCQEYWIFDVDGVEEH